MESKQLKREPNLSFREKEALVEGVIKRKQKGLRRSSISGLWNASVLPLDHKGPHGRERTTSRLKAGSYFAAGRTELNIFQLSLYSH